MKGVCGHYKSFVPAYFGAELYVAVGTVVGVWGQGDGRRGQYSRYSVPVMWARIRKDFD